MSNEFNGKSIHARYGPQELPKYQTLRDLLRFLVNLYIATSSGTQLSSILGRSSRQGRRHGSSVSAYKPQFRRTWSTKLQHTHLQITIQRNAITPQVSHVRVRRWAKWWELSNLIAVMERSSGEVIPMSACHRNQGFRMIPRLLNSTCFLASGQCLSFSSQLLH